MSMLGKWSFVHIPEDIWLGDPYIKINNGTQSERENVFVLKDEYTVEDVFEYWSKNPIRLECLSALNILLITLIRNKIKDLESDTNRYDKHEMMRDCMNINLKFGLAYTGVNNNIKSINDFYYNMYYDNTYNVRDLPAGCYCYIRGCIGWYDWLYNKSEEISDDLEYWRSEESPSTVYQGENVLSLGNSEFLIFSRDYNGLIFEYPQYVIQTYSEIIDELESCGKNELSKVYKSNEVIKIVSDHDRTNIRSVSKYKVGGIEISQQLIIVTSIINRLKQ